MTYTELENRVKLEMSPEEWLEMLLMAGFAAGAASDRGQFWRWIDLCNRMNATNPHFTPYEIPEEYRSPLA